MPSRQPLAHYPDMKDGRSPQPSRRDMRRSGAGKEDDPPEDTGNQRPPGLAEPQDTGTTREAGQDNPGTATGGNQDAGNIPEDQHTPEKED